SPTICQQFVASTLSPVHLCHPYVIICHYTNDMLLCTPHQSPLQQALSDTIRTVQDKGSQVAPDKIQHSSPFKYLGWHITNSSIQPQQPLTLKINDTMTLNDLQCLLRALNWPQPILSISTEELHPLFNLLKGDPALSSRGTLTREAKQALQPCSQAIENRQ
ncbi:POK8 protein, partial [Formicarius rufipectus]|nr:POK8 protein [Formicarius rufipectus]